MGLSWEALDIDAHDPQRIASFWEAALGWRRTHDSPDEVVIEPPEGSAAAGVAPEMLFLRVPEDKVVKNRLHIDLRPDTDQAAEVARLQALGATPIDIGQGEQTWTVLADPDGNEFCVLRVRPPDDGAGG